VGLARAAGSDAVNQPEALLTDAQVAARLNLEIRQFQGALRKGLIPKPMLVAGQRRWTIAQLRSVMGEAAVVDRAAAEAEMLDAIAKIPKHG
jgi:hypothetical protein